MISTTVRDTMWGMGRASNHRQFTARVTARVHFSPESGGSVRRCRDAQSCPCVELTAPEYQHALATRRRRVLDVLCARQSHELDTAALNADRYHALILNQVSENALQ
jgi:hypothetical protein